MRVFNYSYLKAERRGKNMDICSTELCTGCGLCENLCPKQCITLREAKDGFFYPVVDEPLCVGCHLCEKRCPINNELTKSAGQFYMGWHKSQKVLQNSSSGGIFTAVATAVLKDDGVVFGAKFNSVTRNVAHDYILSIDELDSFRLSKYYQSQMGDIYKYVKQFLLEGKKVLFTGTACQIAAVYDYLGKEQEYSNLYTMDVLCHGVASKKTVLEYIKDKEKEYKKKIVNYRFRTKINGWKDGEGTRMQLLFADGSTVLQDKFADTFYYGFNHNLFLRESCYRCKYCGQERISDITVGDFWGISEEKVGTTAMKYGVSVILLNTEKAKQLIPTLLEDIELLPINPDDAIPYNRAFVEPNERPSYRDYFFDVMAEKGFDNAVSKDAPYYFFKQKVKKFLVRFIPERYIKSLLTKIRCNR